ncbi:arylsulfatase [Ulvibacterium sp.]|uniref:arylsulfatase n=1 Tax=Ulvibacterium sp. TaxID=2665914 RepID=UPI003BAD5225
MGFFSRGIFYFLLLSILSCTGSQKKERVIAKIEHPNVILVMTDDQGIGDLGAHGNPWIQTPNIDAFYNESLRLTDFHVSPLCTPTRSALMTGQYPINNGVWATFKGRDMLHGNSIIIPEVFHENGYVTGLFGKWHLGNNYPSRPTDKGFDVAVHHNSGGVGELSDYWGNNYFNDIYLVNNEPKQFEGYCTDIWFDEAIKFIEDQKDKPFFIYLPTNAPHHPLYVSERYSKPYDSLVEKHIPSAEFYGMITNIDDNFGKLDKALKELGLYENTILIFCTDNGSQFGVSPDYRLGWNKGFRGRKSDKLEAGHRVPFFIRWPEAGIKGGKDLNDLTAHVDLLPTLAGLCNIVLPTNFEGDGIDFSKTLLDPNEKIPERTVFVHHRQDYRPPAPLKGSCIMRGKWRLLNGSELYDITTDPKQENNIPEDYPEVVAQLLEDNKTFISKAIQKKEYQELAYKKVGSNLQKTTTLTIQHALGEDGPIWMQDEIAAGIKNKNASHPIEIVKKGLYRIRCRRWPVECTGTIQGIPQRNPKGLFKYRPLDVQEVKISLFDKSYQKKVESLDEHIDFEIELFPGKTILNTQFIIENRTYGVYYTYVELLKEL